MAQDAMVLITQKCRLVTGQWCAGVQVAQVLITQKCRLVTGGGFVESLAVGC